MNKLRMATSISFNSIDNVNFTDAGGQTFLHHFLQIIINVSCHLTSDRLSMVLRISADLLDREASAELVDNYGFSLLQMIVDNPQKEIVQLILKKLKNICRGYLETSPDEHKYSLYESPLDLDYVVKLLRICLENRVDFNVNASINESPVITVCKYSLIGRSKKLAAVTQLINMGFNVNDVDSNGYSALHYAVEKQGCKLVKRLIELGAEVNQRTEEQHTPLYFALRIQSVKKIEILLKAGVNINAKIDRYTTPLMFAMMNSYKTEFIRFLIDNGADMNCQDSISGLKPLHIAAFKYNCKLFHLIVQKEPDVNVRTAGGFTALQLASGVGALKIAEILINRGADVNYQEPKNGLASIHMASITKHASAKLFNSIIPFFNHPFRSSDIIAELVKAGADVNVRDRDGWTPLHYATHQSPHRMLEYDVLPTLLSLGADVNRPADDGHLPLHNAMKDRSLMAVKHLTRFGADLDNIEPQYFNIPWNPSDEASYEKIKAFYYYMNKLNVAGLPAINIPEFYRNDNPQYRIPYDEYSEEVTKLKNYFIDDRISLYDWLHINHTKARPFYLSGVPPELETEFPHYYEIILARYRMIMERIPLLETAKLAFNQITEIHLPDICLERILFYLNNKYLYLLAASSEN